MGNWKDAYEAQMGLWKWARSVDGRNQMLNTVNFHQIPETSQPLFVSLVAQEENKLLGAEPIFVADEFCDLCEHAQHGFEPEPLLATDFLTPQGFVFFEKPIQIPTKDPAFNEMLAGFSWTPLMYDRSKEADDSWDPVSPEGFGQFPQEGDWFPGGVALTLYAVVPENRRENRYQDGAPMILPGIVPFHLTPWYFDMTFEGNEIDINGEETAVAVWWRLCQVTLRLMQQKLAARDPQMVDRHSRKRGMRLGFAPRETVVVRLRRHRAAPTNNDPQDVHWTHRWEVHGGWQWRRHGPGHSLRRQVWIGVYIKGPKDKPLILKDRAFQWEE
jgi:hypothetical protein